MDSEREERETIMLRLVAGRNQVIERHALDHLVGVPVWFGGYAAEAAVTAVQVAPDGASAEVILTLGPTGLETR